MKIVANIKPIMKRVRAEKLEITPDQVQKILNFYFEDSSDKLAKGDIVKIPRLGTITPSYKAGVSYLNQDPLEYETIKFNFSAFTELKSKAKERLSSVQKKVL